MDKCKFCGQRIIFRYVDDILRPIHLNGPCSPQPQQSRNGVPVPPRKMPSILPHQPVASQDTSNNTKMLQGAKQTKDFEQQIAHERQLHVSIEQKLRAEQKRCELLEQRLSQEQQRSKRLEGQLAQEQQRREALEAQLKISQRHSMLLLSQKPNAPPPIINNAPQPITHPNGTVSKLPLIKCKKCGQPIRPDRIEQHMRKVHLVSD